MLRTVVIGPAHWHLPLSLEPMLERDDLEYVGVADPDLAGAQKVADRLGTILISRPTPFSMRARTREGCGVTCIICPARSPHPGEESRCRETTRQPGLERVTLTEVLR